MKKLIRLEVSNGIIRSWIEESFKEYMKINWKDLSNREKDIALSVKTSFLLDVNKLFNKTIRDKEPEKCFNDRFIEDTIEYPEEYHESIEEE